MIRPAFHGLLAATALLIGVIGLASLSFGHALQPGYLELRAKDADHYQALWKVPNVRGRPMAIAPILPSICDAQNPDALTWNGSAYMSRWDTRCPGGLAGHEVRIEGLESTSTDVLVRLELERGKVETYRLTPADPTFTVKQASSWFDVVQTYLLLGVEHILSGVDHLMFVFALMLIVQGARRLIATITAFTVAHSLTLAGATLGFIHAPGTPIEAVIALSIMFVAAEIVQRARGVHGLTEKFPWIVAFVFGLLHGFGFAGALGEIGLPEDAVPMALLFFNIGVEIGQLLFVGAVLTVIALGRFAAKRIDFSKPRWSSLIAPYVIGGFAAFWVIDRIAGF